MWWHGYISEGNACPWITDVQVKKKFWGKSTYRGVVRMFKISAAVGKRNHKKDYMSWWKEAAFAIKPSRQALGPYLDFVTLPNRRTHGCMHDADLLPTWWQALCWDFLDATASSAYWTVRAVGLPGNQTRDLAPRAFFPSMSELRVLLKVDVCYTSLHVHTFRFTSLLLLIFTFHFLHSQFCVPPLTTSFSLSHLLIVYPHFFNSPELPYFDTSSLLSLSLPLFVACSLFLSLSLSLSCSLFGLPSVMVSLLFPFVSIRCLLRYLSAGLCMLQLCESAIRCKELPVGGDTFFQIISLDLEGSNCFGPDVFWL